jgi:hypothetical protein
MYIVRKWEPLSPSFNIIPPEGMSMDLDASKKYTLIAFMCKLLNLPHPKVPVGSVRYTNNMIEISLDGTSWIQI